MVQNSIYYLICLNNHFWHFQIGYIWCNILVTLVVHELHLEADLILVEAEMSELKSVGQICVKTNYGFASDKQLC
mgnify:CR=1 FL=1